MTRIVKYSTQDIETLGVLCFRSAPHDNAKVVLMLFDLGSDLVPGPGLASSLQLSQVPSQTEGSRAVLGSP